MKLNAEISGLLNGDDGITWLQVGDGGSATPRV
jgi:hypothetical protein